MLLFFTLQTICSARYATTKSETAAHAVIVFIFLFSSYAIAFSPSPVPYTLEIHPYPLRAKGFAVLNFVNPVALQNIGWKYYVSQFLSM